MVSQNLPTLDWNGCSRSEWDRLLSVAGRSSLEQSWSYGEAMHRFYGHAADRAIIRRGGETLAMVQVFRRPVAKLATVVRIVRGPLWLLAGTEEATRIAAYRAIRQSFLRRRREFLFWIPELPDAPASDTLMRATGTRRIVTGLSSAWLDLSPDEAVLRKAMAGRWRNALARAERQGTRVDLSRDGRILAGQMAVYEAFRRRKRFVGPPGGFVAAMGETGRREQDVLVLGASAGDDLVAGIVLIRHGASATYYVSWTGEEGRRRGAHNLLLWRGIAELKRAGVRWLDLGGLNTASAAGIARFKLGLGPEVFTLSGTYF